MQLVVDIGNTDTVFGLYDRGTWTHKWRRETHLHDQLTAFLSKQVEELETNPKISFITLSSVVPAATDSTFRQVEEVFGKKPILIGPDLFRKLDMYVLKPEEIGSDLVANAYGAWKRFGTASIVVDFGTTLTFTAVNHEGNIEGVAFAPGLKTAMYALSLKAAQLPEVPLELPATAIGKSTSHALQSGLVLGYVGLVKEILTRFDEELGGGSKTVATGGLSHVLTPLHEVFDLVDRTHTINGLRLLGEYAHHNQRQ